MIPDRILQDQLKLPNLSFSKESVVLRIILIFVFLYSAAVSARFYEPKVFTFGYLQDRSEYQCDGDLDGETYEAAPLTFYLNEEDYVGSIIAMDPLQDVAESSKIVSGADFQFLPGVSMLMASKDTQAKFIPITFSGHYFLVSFSYPVEKVVNQFNKKVSYKISDTVEQSLYEASRITSKYDSFLMTLSSIGNDLIRLNFTTNRGPRFGGFVCKKRY